MKDNARVVDAALLLAGVVIDVTFLAITGPDLQLIVGIVIGYPAVLVLVAARRPRWVACVALLL